MLNLLKTTKGRIGITVVTSIVITVIWFSFKLPIAILPAVLVPQWIPIFVSGQGELISSRSRRRLLLALAVGVLISLVGIRVVVMKS